MKTERLYYNDPYLLEFDANVVDTRTVSDRVGVVLDKTAFYPTSGGQPFDDVAAEFIQHGLTLQVEADPVEVLTELELVAAQWPSRRAARNGVAGAGGPVEEGGAAKGDDGAAVDHRDGRVGERQLVAGAVDAAGDDGQGDLLARAEGGAHLRLERGVSRQHDDLRLARCTALPPYPHRIFSHRNHDRSHDHGPLPPGPFTGAAGVAEVDWLVDDCVLAACCWTCW